jgi:hypothetical protein
LVTDFAANRNPYSAWDRGFAITYFYIRNVPVVI